MKVKKIDLREKLITIFERLYDFHSTLGKRGNIATQYRISSYAKILSILKKFDRPIYSSKDVEKIPYIGKSTLEKIDVIQQTGTHPLYEEILKNREYKILLSFQRIRGIGAEKAYQIYKDGYSSLATLKRDILSNHYQPTGINLRDLKASLLYMKDLEKKIPHQEITDFGNYLRKKFHLHLIHSGSHRMERAYSGDIDILCVVKERKESKRVIEMLKEANIYKHIYNQSDKKINGIIQNPLTKKIHQMDMLFVYEKEVPWMLLYFGSGKEFSKEIRAIAIEKGYTLNEKGLYDIKSKRRIPFSPKSEEDIFAFLDIPYIPPYKR